MKKIIGVFVGVGVVGLVAQVAFAELSTMSGTSPASISAPVVAPASDSKEAETEKVVSRENISHDTKIEKTTPSAPTPPAQTLQPAAATVPAMRTLQTQTTLKDEGKVSGNTEVVIEVKEKVKVVTAEVTLSRDTGGTPLYLGKAQVDPSSKQVSFPWNSSNTPDGSYKLSTVITTEDGVVSKGDSVTVVVKNEEQKTVMVKDMASGKIQQVSEKHADEKFIEDVRNARMTKEKEIKKEISNMVKVPVAETMDTGKIVSSEVLPAKIEGGVERSFSETPSSELRKIADRKVEELVIAIRESDAAKKKQLTDDLANIAQISHKREQEVKSEPADVVSQGVVAKTVTDGVAKLEQVAIEQQSGSVDIKNFSVDSVQVAEVITKPDGTPTASKITFHGKALPNSFATLYIFSIPVVVTVKTDSEGNWNYTLDKELEDGKHQVYVAITDVKGKVVSKSSPLPFIKVASAITVEQMAPVMMVDQQNPPSLVENNYFYGIIVVIVLIIAAVLIFIGVKRSKEPSL